MQRQKTTVALATVAALLALAPGTAMAIGNEIDQGSFNTATENNNEIFVNEADFFMGEYGAYDAAMAAANCQLITVADAWVLVLAASEALGVISDEDDIVIASEPMQDGLFGALDAETATAACNAPVGPVSIVVAIEPGWGAAAPHGGGWAEALSSYGKGGGGKGNSISQGSFDTTASLDDALKNEAEFRMSVVNGAAAAANCQALIGAHLGVGVVGVSSAEGTIEDSDSIVVAGAEDVGTASASPSSVNVDIRALIEVVNDHTATASCEQPIESIDIWVGSATDRLDPES